MTTPTDTGDRGRHRDQSLGELVGEISRDLSTLVRQELALAKAELAQTAKRAGAGAGLLAGAAWSVQLVLLFLSLALWWALATGLGDGASEPALGAAGLIVAGIWAVIGVVLALAGRAQLRRAPGVEQTAETVKKIPPALKGQER